MDTYQKEISLRTARQGLHDCTDRVQALLYDASIKTGLCSVFIRHTSASLVIQENADPSARYDLEKWICKTVPEDDPDYTHTAEGPDDMPAHIKSALTATSLTIPVSEGSLALGRWQGIYLWEHRTEPHTRNITITLVGTS